MACVGEAKAYFPKDSDGACGRLDHISSALFIAESAKSDDIGQWDYISADWDIGDTGAV